MNLDPDPDGHLARHELFCTCAECTARDEAYRREQREYAAESARRRQYRGTWVPEQWETY